MEHDNIDEVSKQFLHYGLTIKEGILSYDDLLRCLAEYINDLMTNDFLKLVQLLYRLDVSEEKVRMLIKEKNDPPASLSIAQLIIERQLKKIQQRSLFKKAGNIPDDEKW